MAQENTEQTKNSERSFMHPTELPPECSQCRSKNVCRDGIRYNTNGEVIQRWLCKNCSYRFSKKHYNKLGASQHAQKVDRQILNCANALPFNCQGSCEALSGAPTSPPRLVQNLAEVETRQERAQREGTLQSADIKGQLVEYLWYMKKKGYA